MQNGKASTLLNYGEVLEMQLCGQRTQNSSSIFGSLGNSSHASNFSSLCFDFLIYKIEILAKVIQGHYNIHIFILCFYLLFEWNKKKPIVLHNKLVVPILPFSHKKQLLGLFPFQLGL